MTELKASTQTAGTDMDLRLELQDLAPDPVEEWQRMLDFVRLDPTDRESMARTVEPLFRRGQELVVQTYAYLSSVPETAAILGWETQVDEAHLEERRRFFTVWLARTLGLDTSEEFAYYLFRAGKFHAGHGPRKIHTPPAYVTASIGMVLAAFSHYLTDAGLSGEVIASGMAGWTKYLSVQLHLMLMGYQAAQNFDRGVYPVEILLFGRLRPLVGRAEILTQADRGQVSAQYSTSSLITILKHVKKRWIESGDRLRNRRAGGLTSIQLLSYGRDGGFCSMGAMWNTWAVLIIPWRHTIKSRSSPLAGERRFFLRRFNLGD
jgi:hypothetical protein